jgi:hypothetical protein
LPRKTTRTKKPPEWALAHAEISHQSALLLFEVIKQSDILPEQMKEIAAQLETLQGKIEEARHRKDLLIGNEGGDRGKHAGKKRVFDS